MFFLQGSALRLGLWLQRFCCLVCEVDSMTPQEFVFIYSTLSVLAAGAFWYLEQRKM